MMLKKLWHAMEVAIRNAEAAESTISDLEEAAKLAEKTKIGIAENPDKAIGSVGSFDKHALELLE